MKERKGLAQNESFELAYSTEREKEGKKTQKSLSRSIKQVKQQRQKAGMKILAFLNRIFIFARCLSNFHLEQILSQTTAFDLVTELFHIKSKR